MIPNLYEGLPKNHLKHVLCVYPYKRELNDVGFYPPLGLEFIASTIKPFSAQIEIIDMRKERKTTLEYIRPDTNMICFSINWDRDYEYLRNEILSVPEGMFVLLGGRHASHDPELWLRDFPNVNAVVRGDGEEAVEEICQGVPFKDIDGISFRSAEGIVHNKNRILGPIKDHLYPDRSIRKYDYDVIIGGVSTGIRVDMVASSRGCPFNCSFCSFARNPWGSKRKWSARSPESVVEELEQIQGQIIGFTDDIFTYDMSRVEKICDLIIARGIRKKYFINARLEIAKYPEIMKKMEKAGFSMLMLGIESANDKTLKSMGKGFNTEQIRNYFKILSKSKMFLHGYFILGNIGESRQDMDRILPFAQELGLDTIALSNLRIEPYSGLEELINECPDYHIAANGKVFSDAYSVQYFKDLRREIYKKFFTPIKISRIINKGIRIGFLRFVPPILHRVPLFLVSLIKQRIKRARRKAEKRAEHLKNNPL